MKTLVVYYSYGGNTRGVAEQIQRATGADIAEIKTAEPYTGSYDDVVDQGEREVRAGYKPAILPLEKDIADYDTIVLGTPVWWYTFAPAVKTFLESADWNGKRVYPFATNGGWLGHTPRDIERACAGATVGKTLNIRFDGHRQATPAATVEAWIRNIH